MRQESLQNAAAKDPYTDVFHTMHEFVTALNARGVETMDTLESNVLASNGEREVAAIMAKSGEVYLVEQAGGKVIFIQSAKNWNEAKALAEAYFG